MVDADEKFWFGRFLVTPQQVTDMCRSSMIGTPHIEGYGFHKDRNFKRIEPDAHNHRLNRIMRGLPVGRYKRLRTHNGEK